MALKNQDEHEKKITTIFFQRYVCHIFVLIPFNLDKTYS